MKAVGVRSAILLVLMALGLQPAVGEDAGTRATGSNGSGEVPARMKIKSAPKWHGDHKPENVLTDDSNTCWGAAEESQNQAFIFELDLETGQRVTKVEWKGFDADRHAPARLSLEAQIGEEWKHVAEFDSQKTGERQAHAVSPSYRSKIWRLTFLRSHDTDYALAVRTVRFMVRTPPFRQQLWLDSPYTDVKVVSGKSFVPAHRAILAMASPVLAAMLAEAQQRQEQEIQVQDVGEESVRDFLEYLYTEDVAKGADFGVVVLGHKYGVAMLAEEVAPQALKNLSPASVVRAISLMKPYEKDAQIKPLWEALMKKVREGPTLFATVMSRMVEDL